MSRLGDVMAHSPFCASGENAVNILHVIADNKAKLHFTAETAAAPRRLPPSDKIQSSTVNFFPDASSERGRGGIKMLNLHRAILHEDGKIDIGIHFIVLRYLTLSYHVDTLTVRGVRTF